MAKKTKEINKTVEKKTNKKSKKKNKQSAPENKKILDEKGKKHSGKESLFGSDRKTITELVAPEGVEFSDLNYSIVYDVGNALYTMGLYIDDLPNNTQFAQTYARLLNFSGVTTSIFIEPLAEAEARQMADRRVRELSAELADAQHDPNRLRTMTNKLATAQAWASKIESGDEKVFCVQFLFLISAPSLDELRRTVNSFSIKAAGSGIEVVGCFGAQAEAMLSSFPLNKCYKLASYKNVVKPLYLDMEAMADIFNHTNSSFLHEDGVFAGYYIDNGQVCTWDPFDKSHSNYGTIFCGTSGIGKSATIKMLQKRMIDFGMRVRTLDVDSPGRKGEYSTIALASGGIHFEIVPGSENTLNPYELNVETRYDPTDNTEENTIELSDKISYLSSLFLFIVNENEGVITRNTEAAVISIVERVNRELYADLGIIDQDAESLYERKTGNFLGSERVRKQMPTFTDAYKKILLYRKVNTNTYDQEAYEILVKKLSRYIKELYYGEHSLHYFTREEYQSLPVDENGLKYWNSPEGKEYVLMIKGTRSYFDGQSSIAPSYDTPYIDYDISQLPAADKPFAMIACLGYMEENDVRTNSANPLKAKKMIVLMDELHNTFPYEAARQIITRFYRQARKRFVSPWSATQSLNDYSQYQDMLGVLKNSDTLFVFRHTDYDRDFIKTALSLTDTQVERILSLGIDPKNADVTEEERDRRRGEVCLIDAKRVTYIKMYYLRNTEAPFVETNVAKLKEMAEKKKK